MSDDDGIDHSVDTRSLSDAIIDVKLFLDRYEVSLIIDAVVLTDRYLTGDLTRHEAADSLDIHQLDAMRIITAVEQLFYLFQESCIIDHRGQ